jgi:hypothetical protein
LFVGWLVDYGFITSITLKYKQLIKVLNPQNKTKQKKNNKKNKNKLLV